MINTAMTQPARAARPQQANAYPVSGVVNGKVVHFEGDNIQLFVRPNSDFNLTLPEPGGTGYSWHLEMDRKTAQLVKVTQDEVAMPKAFRPGAPNQHSFSFKLQPGASTGLKFKLELQRPWAETVPPADVKTVTLAVGYDAV